MRPPAHVTALDLLRDFRAALMTFRANAQDALAANDIDIRRARDWLAEQRQTWQRQVRVFYDEVVRAKAELSQRQMVCAGDRVPDCTEQIKALRRAQHRLAHAEEQVDRTRAWEPALQRAVEEYEGPARQLGGLLDADLPKAAAHLDRRLAALEAYIATENSCSSSSLFLPPSPASRERGDGDEGEEVPATGGATPSPPSPLPRSGGKGSKTDGFEASEETEGDGKTPLSDLVQS